MSWTIKAQQAAYLVLIAKEKVLAGIVPNSSQFIFQTLPAQIMAELINFVGNLIAFKKCMRLDRGG